MCRLQTTPNNCCGASSVSNTSTAASTNTKSFVSVHHNSLERVQLVERPVTFPTFVRLLSCVCPRVVLQEMFNQVHLRHFFSLALVFSQTHVNSGFSLATNDSGKVRTCCCDA